jgi:hypothetical protein
MASNFEPNSRKITGYNYIPMWSRECPREDSIYNTRRERGSEYIVVVKCAYVLFLRVEQTVRTIRFKLSRLPSSHISQLRYFISWIRQPRIRPESHGSQGHAWVWECTLNWAQSDHQVTTLPNICGYSFTVVPRFGEDRNAHRNPMYGIL